jgi:hypothetical protein
MTTNTAPVVVRLDEQTVEALATRLADLLANRASRQDPPGSRQAGEGAAGRLLSAAQVAARWGVDRSWVYQHAQALGAIRLGTGTRPRLRFDPDRVTDYLTAEDRSTTASASRARPARRGDRRRSPRRARDRGDLLPILGDSELSSPRPQSSRPGGAPTPPATAPTK